MKNKKIKKITNNIIEILKDNNPSIYLCGSIVTKDFKIGWSDIDILVLTQKEITNEQAESLIYLRQTLLKEEPNNKYYRSFEGGILSLETFLNKTPSNVVYWGTSGQKITDNYIFNSLSLLDILENNILVYGEDVLNKINKPLYKELYNDVENHYMTIRTYAKETNRSIYSFSWFLDISRCIYTLQTGKIKPKTDAAKWALKKGLCPDSNALKTAIKVRNNPNYYKNNEKILIYAETLGNSILEYANVLEKELIKHKNTLI